MVLLYFFTTFAVCASMKKVTSSEVRTDLSSQNTTGNIFSVDVHGPSAQGWSGGWCLASMSEAGWLRSTVLSSRMSEVLSMGLKTFPLMTGTNSGGSMFATRYFVLTNHASTKLWNYPCYLMSRPYSVACFFHGTFGAISSECYAETFNVIMTATTVAYGSIIQNYGGPLGVASTYLGVYFPFLADLPAKASSLSWNAFTKRFLRYDTRSNAPSNWLAAHTLDAPVLAGKNLYNYGFNSFLSRAVSAFHGATLAPSSSNLSIAWVVAASANTQSGIVLLPFALAGKSWDGVGAASNGASKLFAMVISFTMVKKMMATHEVMDATVLGEDSRACIQSGCPILDGGFTDNAPLTPILSQGTGMPSQIRPSWIISVGASSTMATIKYLMGVGPLHVYEMGGINMCPFTIAGICNMLSKVRDLSVLYLPRNSVVAYRDLGATFQVFRPEIKLLAPYCADPLTYDLFHGQCEADGMCDMWSTAIPSRLNNVRFTPDPFVFVFVMAYLKKTPVSARFVNLYAPQEMWEIEYYSHMDMWFPNFDATASAKGGIGFTNIAGNAFMDFMTYLNIRLVAYLVKTKVEAKEIVKGMLPGCFYKEYEEVAAKTMSISEANQLPRFR